MRTPLHILHLESGALDAQIIQAMLAEALAAELTCVQTLAAFVDALERGNYDIILADYSLPSLDGISALKIVREKLPDIPFIFVSRSPGEEAAIESLRIGATDFVLKHRLARLVPSVIDALTQAEERQQRKLFENYIGQRNTIESITALAGGMGHDLNNLLTAIIGKAQLAQEQLDPDHPVFESIRQIEQTSRRAAELTHQLLIVSHRQDKDPQSTSLNHALADFVQTLRRIVGNDVEVGHEIAPDLPQVIADPSEIAQALMNLALHRLAAMARGGRITITTRDLVLNDDLRRRHPSARPGRYLQIELADTGQGPADESHTLAPSFTAEAQGGRFGSSIVHGIIKQQAGFIEVESEPGLGSNFSLFFPIKQEITQQVATAAHGGSETILVAEDDLALLKLAGQVLDGLGYRVILARDGLEAVSLFASNRSEIDLVTLDISMPKLGGLEAYKRIRELDPEIPVILMSGDIEQAKCVEETDAGLLEKPYNVAALGREVRKWLDQPRTKSSSGSR